MTTIRDETLSSIIEAERSDLWSVDDCAEQMRLEEEADALLAREGAICSLRGVRKRLYTDRQLMNHRRRELTNYEEGLGLFPVAERELFELIGEDLAGMVGRACLSLRQHYVWGLYMTGMSQGEIARATKTTQSTVSRHLSAGKRKIVAALVADPFYGWWDVYWSEVHRTGKIRK